MRSRMLREGSVGLLILVGVSLFGGLVLWLRGINPGARAYELEVELENAAGMEVGSAVRFRGIKVGSVTAMKADTNQVTAVVSISPGTLLIPRDVTPETTQSGFIGQVFLDLRPAADATPAAVSEKLTAFAPNCDRVVVLCDGDRLKGKVGANFDELIRATTNIAELLDNSELIANANRTLDKVAVAADGISTASKGVNLLTDDTRKRLGDFSVAANSVTGAAKSVSGAAGEVNTLIQANRGTINSALTNLDQAGQELKVAINALSPVITRVQKGQLLTNLETLASNGAKASANLRDFSATLNSPLTVLGLAQTLDSARVTFQNARKITTNLEPIAGDPTLKANILKLLKGLNKLVSSSQELDQQLQALQAVDKIETAGASDRQPVATQVNPAGAESAEISSEVIKVQVQVSDLPPDLLTRWNIDSPYLPSLKESQNSLSLDFDALK
jgi:phospholipid/cholesterol/gamma-HCH transport system substrate-binding protein